MSAVPVACFPDPLDGAHAGSLIEADLGTGPSAGLKVHAKCPDCKCAHMALVNPNELPPRKGETFLIFCAECRKCFFRLYR